MVNTRSDSASVRRRKPLLELAGAVGAEGAGHGRRQRDRPAAAPRLRLHSSRLRSPAASVRDADRAGLEVNVGPTEAEHLALAKAQGKANGVEGLEPVAPDGVEKARACSGDSGGISARGARGGWTNVATFRGTMSHWTAWFSAVLITAWMIPTLRGDRPDASLAFRSAWSCCGRSLDRTIRPSVGFR